MKLISFYSEEGHTVSYGYKARDVIREVTQSQKSDFQSLP